MRRYGTFVYLPPVVAAATLLAPAAHAQRSETARTVFPICIGDCRRVVGLRLNFRYARLERVDGINVTIWTPYEPMSGVVTARAETSMGCRSGGLESPAAGR